MKRSKNITLGLLALTAIVACDDDHKTQAQEIRHCVNEDGVVVDESLCAPLDQALLDDGGVLLDRPYIGGSIRTNGSGDPIVVPDNQPNPGAMVFYHWYYGGGYSRPLSPGTRIIIGGNGYGSWRPSPTVIYTSPRGVSIGGGSSLGKGGFGGTGRSFSTGGGGGGGGGE